LLTQLLNECITRTRCLPALRGCENAAAQTVPAERHTRDDCKMFIESGLINAAVTHVIYEIRDFTNA